jgi:hypothetical protein
MIMKNLKSIITILFAVFSTCVFAQTNANNGIREAAIRGKSDLVKILSENKEFNFGVSAREVEASQITNPIESFYTNFERLLNDTTGNIIAISGSEQKFIVPFSIDNQVITTVSVVSDSKGTKAVELVNQQYKTELNQLPAEMRRINYKGLKFIRVPNIEASLYIFEDKCYTSYKGGNLREGISISEMTRKLQNDAREFQTKFGEELKKGRLVR